ncbi:MAG: hypothetical protein ABJP48_11485 [Erythrobacter sp.]
MNIPPLRADGLRQTVNRDLSDDELVWHFRSGWNVAALNCTSAQYQPVLTAYSAYISDHATALRQVSERIDSVYRAEHGSRRAGIRAREGKLTSVYNFFALPPARAGFCRAALDVSNRALGQPSADPIAFAMANFTTLETPFNTFFNEYEEYQRTSAAWDAQYGNQYGPSQPGWVAVQAARRAGTVIPTPGDSNPGSTLATPTTPSGLVADDTTGVGVPVISAPGGTVSQPVVEPIPNVDPNAAAGTPDTSQ